MPDFDIRPETPVSMESLKKRAVGTMFNHGVLGLLVFVAIWQGIRLLNIFIPIWIDHFKDDTRAQVQTTAAMQQMAGAMTALHEEIKNKNTEMIASAVNAACAKRR